MANFNLTQTVTNLGTTTVTVPTTDRYTVDVTATHNSLSNGDANSSLVITINVNGSPVFTSVAGARGAKTNPFCTANDVIAVVLSSANVADTGLNAIKATIAISEGM